MKCNCISVNISILLNHVNLCLNFSFLLLSFFSISYYSSLIFADNNTHLFLFPFDFYAILCCYVLLIPYAQY